MNNKAKIGLAHYTYPPVIGGVEKIVFDHAQYFARYGFDTTIFTGEGKNENPKLSLEVIPEFRSLNVTNQSLQEKILNDASFPNEFYSQKERIYQEIERKFNDIDIFFIHNILTFSFNLALNAALTEYIKKHPDKKYIIWVHDVVLDSMRKKRSFKNKEIDELVYKPLENVQYVGISHFLKNTLTEEIGFPASLIDVIPNGIDIGSLLNFHPLTQKIVSKYDILNSDPLIFLPTKIMKHKNIDLCLKILSQIKKQKNRVLLIITAKGFPHNRNSAYVDEMLNLINKLDISKNVILLHNEISEQYRQIEYKIVDDFYRLSDIVYFLSSFENFGLPLLESGITKTPIIVNNLKVFNEIESNNVYYVDVENESIESIAKKTLDIIEKNPQITFFRKVKKEYNFDYIFKTKILPLL